MRIGLIAAVVLLFVSWIVGIVFISKNDTQKKTIKELKVQLLAVDDLEQKNEALKKNFSSLKSELARKINLVESMRKPLPSDANLPVEFVTALQEWANGSEIAEYDPNRAVVKFNTSMLFKSGSDEIEPAATQTIVSLCEILNSKQSEPFDIIIEGHTDNLPILNPSTLAKHPTNLHLSVHRAISVFYIMTDNGVVPERLSVRGFGEFRPIVPNNSNTKGGTPENRRIEIQFVPKGV